MKRLLWTLTYLSTFCNLLPTIQELFDAPISISTAVCFSLEHSLVLQKARSIRWEITLPNFFNAAARKTGPLHFSRVSHSCKICHATTKQLPSTPDINQLNQRRVIFLVLGRQWWVICLTLVRRTGSTIRFKHFGKRKEVFACWRRR